MALSACFTPLIIAKVCMYLPLFVREIDSRNLRLDKRQIITTDSVYKYTAAGVWTQQFSVK